MAANDGKYRDWNWITDRVAQGAYPGAHPGLFQAFDVVVYTAIEAQPRLTAPAGKAVLYAGVDDDIYRPFPLKDAALFHDRAAKCARYVQLGHKVLITCQQGKNRSGLLVGLTLLKLYPGWTAQQVITLIRRNRKLGGGEQALANTMFEQFLRAQR